MEDVWVSWLPDRLLWATRGRSWDFRFLLRAKATGLNPLSLYEAVFAVSEASAPLVEGQPQCFRAKVVDAGGADCWVIGARFLDPDTDCRDEAGRRIPHEILLVGKGSKMPDPRTAPVDWHLQVFQRLAPVYREVYPLKVCDPAVVSPESIKPTLIIRQGSTQTAEWIDLGTLVGVKEAHHLTKQEGVAPYIGLRRRHPMRLHLMVALMLLLLVAAGTVAVIKAGWLRRTLPKPTPQRRAGEPNADGTKSSMGMEPLENGTSLVDKEQRQVR